MYFLVRSDPGGEWGRPEIVTNGFQMSPIALMTSKMYFLVRSDHGGWWGLTEIVKNGLQMSFEDDLEVEFSSQI